MDKPTCIIEDCDGTASSRAMCNKHYLRAWKSGDLPNKGSMMRAWHRLTDVDEDARTGTCAICGPVAVRVRGGKRGNECGNKRQSRERGTPTPTDRRRWKYGLTPAEFDALLAASGGKCAICDVEMGDRFHIDHCHETGAVRGFLCNRCNLALGWFDDSPPRVLAAYMYLKSHGKDDSDWAHRGA